jgi:hypothetical protein
MCQQEQHDMQGLDYRGIVGSINYLATTTRPDLAFAAHCLSRFVSNPGHNHWLAAKHVLRYLQTTIGYALTLSYNNNFMLSGHADSDYAACKDDRRSVSGYTFSLGSGAISWRSRKQQTVATSTTEAEVYAASEAAKEAQHLIALMLDYGFNMKPLKLHLDNQAAIHLSQRNQASGRSKHYSTRLHYIRQLVDDKTLLLEYVPTNDKVADVLTNGLGRTKTGTFAHALLSPSGGFNHC